MTFPTVSEQNHRGLPEASGDNAIKWWISDKCFFTIKQPAEKQTND